MLVELNLATGDVVKGALKETGWFLVFGAFLNSKILDIKTMGDEPNVLKS